MSSRLCFVNMTNGLEWIRLLRPDGLVRIQSTHLEQKLWSRVIEDLDYSFLIPLVSGTECTVLDASHREDGKARAIYQGIPWIKYVVELRCKGYTPKGVRVRSNDVTEYFAEQARKLSPRAKAKLDYAKKFTAPNDFGPVRLEGRSIKTVYDGDYDYFRTLMHSGGK